MVADTTVEWRGKVPYNADGHMLSYAGHEVDHWREQRVWRDSFTLLRWETLGKAHFVLESRDDHTEYPIEPQWFIEAFNEAQVLDGVIWGTWTYTASGGNYSIRLVEA